MSLERILSAAEEEILREERRILNDLAPA